jgi:hypothetical protein
MMDRTKGKTIRIQVLAAKDEAGPGGRAVGMARERIGEIADIARGQGAEALVVCPAPEEFASDGIELVIGARFAPELDEDAVFWRERRFAREIFEALQVHVLVLDLDRSLDGFVKSIEPMLEAPYERLPGRPGGDRQGVF